MEKEEEEKNQKKYRTTSKLIGSKQGIATKCRYILKLFFVNARAPTRFSLRPEPQIQKQRAFS
jgi:hypothetical protein